MTKAQRLGTVFLASGSLIVLIVVLLWLLAPLMIPQSFGDPPLAAHSLLQEPAPALSPFTPPTPSAAVSNVVNSTSTPGGLTPSPSSNNPTAVPTSSDLTINSSDEVQAHLGPDRTSAKPGYHLAIPALGIDVPVVSVGLESHQTSSSLQYQQWSVPDAYAVGWHDSSAPPGQPGNTVLNGHNNIHGAVFGDLVDLTLGEQIIIYEDDQSYVYQVAHREFLPEKGEPLRTRLRNARWIAPSDDDRLTIVTCWPNTSNSHRLVLIAQLITDQGS